MKTLLRFTLSLLLFGSCLQLTAQKKVRFSQIDSPHFFMGDKDKTPHADYTKIVITFTESTDIEAWTTEIQSTYPNLKQESSFEEYHAVIFENTESLSRAQLKRFFKEIQSLQAVSNVTPFYHLDGGQLFYFDLLNFQLKPNTSKEEARQVLEKYELEWLGKYESPYPGGLSIAKVAKGKSIFKVSEKLHATGLFIFAYPMSNRIVSEDYTPNDTDYTDQWHLRQDNDADIDAPEAWGLTTGNSNLVIAVQELDGFDLTHPDLAPNVVSPYNAFLDANTSQYLDNAHTHGTRVAGCSSAVTDNTMGIAGVAFNLKVMPIILTAASSNSVNAVTLQRAADHIIANGNVVAVTNSWSGSGYDAAEESQFQRMRNLAHGGLGSVVLGSTGNYSNMQIRYPACYKNVVGVGRTGQTDFRYSSSNYHDSVDVSAPGSSILTLDIVGSVGATGDYTTASGTSFSTPITAGVVGLMASINPNLTGTELKDYLEQACEKVGNYPYQPVTGRPNGIWHNELGYGRINALHALLLASESFINNDGCAEATPLNQVSATQFCLSNTSLLGATQSTLPLLCSGETSQLAYDAWFEFTAVNSSMEVSVSPLASGLDPVVAVYSSCGSNIVACINGGEGEGFSEVLTLNNLTPSQIYYIRVYDFSADGSLASSFNFDVCAYVSGGSCAAPSALTSNSSTSFTASLDWSAPAGASNYEIALRPSGTSSWEAFISNSNSLLAEDLLCNTLYDWRVRAICDNANVSAWSAISTFNTLDCSRCLTPYNLNASSITSNSAVLSWEATPPTCFIDGFDGRLYEGNASDGTTIDSWSDISATTYNAVGLQANTTYTFRVRQDCDCGPLIRSIYVYYTFTTLPSSTIDLLPSVQSSSLSIIGNNLNVIAGFSNDGMNNASSFQVAYYLSRSPYFNSYDYLLGSNSIGSLSAGSNSTDVFNLDLCSENIPDGTYYLGFYLDNNQTVNETSEVNNLWFWSDLAVNLNCSTPTQYTLSITPSPAQGGTVSGAGTYTAGTMASIAAAPSLGWEFINWTQNGVEFSTSANTSILMDDNKSVEANFGALTSIQDLSEELSFSVSPNPTEGDFVVLISPELIGSSCEMYNISGQLVTSYILLNIKNDVNFDGAAGIYFVKIEHPKYTLDKRVLLKR